MVIMAAALAMTTSVVLATGLLRCRGSKLAPVLFALTIAASVLCYLACAEGRPPESVLFGLTCIGGCLGVPILVARRGTSDRGRSSTTRHEASGTPPRGGRERVEAAIARFAFVPGHPRTQILDLYRFSRGARSVLIVMVRRDVAGHVLDAAIYDIEASVD